MDRPLGLGDVGAIRRVVISGCCGGGKSTLLAELSRRGHATVQEAGRRILAEESAGSGLADPWVDAAAFSRRAIAMSIQDHDAADRLTFYDRGVVDAAVALVATGQPPPAAVSTHRYDHVFLAPPWPDIYEMDADRWFGFEKASRDFERVRKAYVDAGYELITLPLETVPSRADFVLRTLADLAGS